MPAYRTALRTRLTPAVGTGALGVLVLLLVRPAAPLVFDDLAQLAAALFATAGCAGSARRSAGRRRRSWTALALGCGAWAAGQALWTWYELALGRETPFPSVADLAFLGFPLGATVALLTYPAGGTARDRGRRLLDGLVVAASLVLVFWSTTPGSVGDHPTTGLGTLAWAVGTAYPAADVAVLTMAVVLLSRATVDRGALGLVGAGIAAITAADSAFLLLTTTGTYDSVAHPVPLAWCLGFVLVGLAGRVPLPSAELPVTGRTRRAGGASFLPYVPPLVAALVVTGQTLRGQEPGGAEAVLGAALGVAVLSRQYALLRSHSRLVDELAAREAELRTLAFTDGLTGLANRAQFLRRLETALAGHAAGERSVAVLFCDLDDFKAVNDTLGHAAGDRLLVQAAARLSSVLRASDVLARLGGDEFAVLLDDGSDPEVVGRIVTDCLSEPFDVDAGLVLVGASVGTTTVPRGLPTPSPDDVLAQADSAMYAVKRTGKGAARAYEPGLGAAPAG